MHKFISLITLALIGFILWMIYQANTGGHNLFFDWVRRTPNGDKIGHFLLFGSMAFGINLSLRFKILRWKKVGMYWGTTLVLIFVVLEELSQYFFPRRTVDIRDLMADGAGLLCFTVLTAIVHGIVYLIKNKELEVKST